MTRARHRCAACDRPLKAGRHRHCVRGCGARLCRAVHLPPCTDIHGGQCPNLHPPDNQDTHGQDPPLCRLP